LAAARKRADANVVATQPQQPSLIHHQQSFSVSSYSGPMPPPALLDEYERICPGAAQRILAIFEEQARHRMSLESRVVSGGTGRSWAGLGVAALLSLGGLAVAAFAVHMNQPWVAGTVATAVFGADLWAFLAGTSSTSQERQKRTETLAEKKRR
jgi:uncharacterized membrane protein